ncbi:hypothetical protein FA95DRAFT_604502 [Auriscalpium vulgare]|uniref:Uncharacterized protein n=1 Tax=Auriscalpium vulgare TaxID=40419 RepID=A0ACB8S3C4_9AGAM|nr:hypothetical protein FA95DRAFT_604502 [Auriscalpium vulgare]
MANVNVLSVFRDSDTAKEVFLQANGKAYATDGGPGRHVFLHWDNSLPVTKGMFVSQIVQLIGIPGRWTWESVAHMQDRADLAQHTQFSLGTFSRAQRDRILALAEGIAYDPESVVNTCRVWMRELLEAMVKEGLLAQEKMDEIDGAVPLLRRRPEVEA